MRFFEFIGKIVLDIVHMAGKMSILFYETTKGIFKPPFRFRLFIKQIEFIGYKSIPIIILTGIFTGMVFSLQSYKGLNNFGSGEMTSGLIAMAMILELGPVLTGIMVAARAGKQPAPQQTAPYPPKYIFHDFCLVKVRHACKGSVFRRSSYLKISFSSLVASCPTVFSPNYQNVKRRHPQGHFSRQRTSWNAKKAFWSDSQNTT